MLDYGTHTSLNRMYNSKVTAQVSRSKPSFAKRALTFTIRALWPPGQPIFGDRDCRTARAFPACLDGVATINVNLYNDAAALQ